MIEANPKAETKLTVKKLTTVAIARKTKIKGLAKRKYHPIK